MLRTSPFVQFLGFGTLDRSYQPTFEYEQSLSQWRPA